MLLSTTNPMPFKPVLLHFDFPEFEKLGDLEAGDKADSLVQTDCNGHKWSISIQPGGRPDATEVWWVPIYLHSRNEQSMECKYSIAIKGTNSSYEDTIGYTFPAVEERCHVHVSRHRARNSAPPQGIGFGPDQMITRSQILDEDEGILKDDVLTIHVTIQVKDEIDQFYGPTTYINNKMLELLKSGVDSDITFKVEKKTFHAHSLIIKNNAPILGSFFDGKCSVVIRDIKPDVHVFKIVLGYVYSGCFPTRDEIDMYGEELIDAANKFKLTDMKLAVENDLVRECILDKTNVADYILFADAQSCALLKEYAISFLALHSKEILKSEHSKRLRESAELLAEIIVLTNEDDGDAMTVTDLRKELGECGLDVDGSKEMLLSRLSDSKRQRTE